MHPLQIKILQRGLELLKVGGKISYSTCSLNPIEDEAVIAAILQMYGDKVRLLSVELPGFRFQEGLKNWEFMTMKLDLLGWRHNREDIERIEQAK